MICVCTYQECVLQALMAHLARLMSVLEQPPPGQEVQVTPFGRLEPPLGFERYKAVQVVAALLRTDDPTAAAGPHSPLLSGVTACRPPCWAQTAPLQLQVCAFPG